MSERNSTVMEREGVRAAREGGRTSVVVIGAGINGISTFRDLAMQGVDVLLIDRGDFASGATAASSHMIHGGIRYLENGEFRLVKESVQERNGLTRRAGGCDEGRKIRKHRHRPRSAGCERVDAAYPGQRSR